MKQEDKDLLLKDLCARLPYNTMIHGVYAYTNPDYDCGSKSDKILYSENDSVLTASDIDWIEMDAAKIKPYLFPMSSMTEEQEHEWDIIHFNPLDAILEGKYNNREEHLQLLSKSMSDPIQWCYENHFDCNGLIPLGLAIDATGKNIY